MAAKSKTGFNFHRYRSSIQMTRRNTAVKRNAHVRDLRKAREVNKGKLYTKECGMDKNGTKNKKTPENIRYRISEYLPCVKIKFSCVYPLIILFTLFSELYEGAQRYTFPQSLYELKAQLGQQLAHAQTFDRGVTTEL